MLLNNFSARILMHMWENLSTKLNIIDEQYYVLAAALASKLDY